MDPRPDPTTPAAPSGAIRDAGAGGKDARVDDRLVELEGLRGLLALWVAVSHLVCWAGFDTVLDGTRWATAWKHFAYAQVAVHVFVVMSGFAIWKLLSKGSPSWTWFMAGRVFRLYPVYLPALGLALVSAALQPGLMERLAWSGNEYFRVLRAVTASEHRHFAGHLAAHLLLLHGMVPHVWLPRSPAAFFAPGWSLSLEWQFYLVAPLWWRHRRRIATWLVVAGVAFAGARLGGGNPAFLPNAIAFFAIGIVSAEVHAAWPASTARGRRWLAAGLVASLAVMARFAAWHLPSLVLWLPVIIAASGWCGRGRPWNWINAFLRLPWVQSLGHMSYPLYVLHWPVLVLALAGLARLRGDWQGGPLLAVLLAGVLPLILAVSWLAHRFVERPMMDRGRRWIAARRAHAPRPRNATPYSPS